MLGHMLVTEFPPEDPVLLAVERLRASREAANPRLLVLAARVILNSLA